MKHGRILFLLGTIILVFSLMPVNHLYAGQDENIKQWIKQLSDGRERAEAKGRLIKAKGVATAELLNTLEGEHLKLSMQIDIIQIFEKNKTQEAIPYLKTIVNDPRPRMRLASLRALGAMADMDKELSNIFKIAAKDPTPGIRLTAISALLDLEDRSALGIFTEALLDERANIRLKAIEAMMLYKDKSTIPVLIKTLDDKNIAVAQGAMEALANFKDKQVVEALIGKLDSTQREIKVKAVEALAIIGDKSAIAQLKSLQDDEYIKVRHAADKAIKSISG